MAGGEGGEKRDGRGKKSQSQKTTTKNKPQHNLMKKHEVGQQDNSRRRTEYNLSFWCTSQGSALHLRYSSGEVLKTKLQLCSKKSNYLPHHCHLTTAAVLYS